MRTLDEVEKEVLLDFFAPSGNGYVLDFVDESFNSFTQKAIGVRVKELYAEEGLSKGKSLRRYVTTVGDDEKVYKLLTELMRYYELKLRDQSRSDPRLEAAYQKCKNILVACAPVNKVKTSNPGIDAELGKMKRLYVDGAYFLVSDSEDKIRIALEHLASFVKGMVAAREWRIFGCPLYARTVYEMSQLGGDSIRPAETKMAEGAWRSFGNALAMLLRFVAKMEGCPFDATRFVNWVTNHKAVTESVGGYDFYRGISSDVLSGLLEYSKAAAIGCHPDFSEQIEMMYGGVYFDDWDRVDFLPVGSSVSPALPSTRFELSGSGRGVVVDTRRAVPAVTEEDKNDIAKRTVDLMREGPMEAVVVGLSKTGAAQVSAAAQVKRSERGLFPDKVIQALFGVGENTPGNWRNGRVAPPPGFLEAFDKQDPAAMYECAERYKRTRKGAGKGGDAMNTDGLEHGLSDEQIYQQGGYKK